MRPSDWKNGASWEWQVIAGLDDEEPITERPEASPTAAVEVRETLRDGTELKAVWSYLRQSEVGHGSFL
jgi:hypothetical protein